jgi:hypothetical protein
MATFAREEDLIPGRWYAVGFRQIESDQIDWAGAMLYKYEGDGIWTDEAGEEVTDTLDPHLQIRVPCGAADEFALQG